MRTLWASEVDGLVIRQERRVTVVKAEQYDPGFPPSQLDQFAAWLDEMIEQIPEEYRSTATVEFDSVSSYYDSHYAEVEISYRRPETDKEWEARKADVMGRLNEQEAQERRAYEALKAKFEQSK